MAHLWDHDHSYYCSEFNFYHAGLRREYTSWAQFVDGDPYSNFDLNLLFRWDWHLEEDGHLLELFWMLQRKGIFQSDAIKVTPEDEPGITTWLEPRWQHIRTMWLPLSESQP